MLYPGEQVGAISSEWSISSRESAEVDLNEFNMCKHLWSGRQSGVPNALRTLAMLFLAFHPTVSWQSLLSRHGCCPVMQKRSTIAMRSAPRVAVFGGRGFIGSRVCRTLVQAGSEVVSVSLSSAQPEWATGEPWVQQVQWFSTDSAKKSLGQLDAAVSCVGNLRPSSDWDGFWGLNWDDETLRRQNGDVTEEIAEAAQRAGARRFAYVSVSSDVAFAFGGALQGYIDGKKQGEAAVRRVYGDGAVIVGPSLVYGGGRFAAAGKAYEAITNSGPVKLQLSLLASLQQLSAAATGPWEQPQDMATKVALTPPVDVDTAALAIAAGVLGSTTESFINGSVEIRQVAGEDGRPELLQAAAVKLAQARSAIQVLGSAAPQLISKQSFPMDGAASAEGAPFEGALVGARPLLYPLPIAIALSSLLIYVTTASSIS